MIRVAKNLYIRKLRRDNVDQHYAFIRRPIILRMIWGRTKAYARKDAQRHINKNIQRYQIEKKLVRQGTGKKISFALEFEGQLIGGIGYTPQGETAEIGYWLARPYWGQGLMPKVVKGFCAYLNERHGITRFEAKTFPSNVRSGRVLEKAGFRKIALAVRDEKIGRRYFDHIFYTKVLK